MDHEQQAGNGRDERAGALRSPSGFRFLTTGLLFVMLPACGGGGGDGGGSGVNPGGGGGTGTADLSFASITFSPSQASPGEALHVLDVVRNTGSGSATNFQVGIYLSSDTAITSADTLIGSRVLGVLNPGATSNGSGFMTVPLTTPEGPWYVGALVDVAGNVPEANEGNNSAIAVQILEVSSVPAPDLIVSQVTVDTSVVLAGQPIGVTDMVQNTGIGAATEFQVGIYLSEDGEITPDDLLLGLRSITSLSPGEASFLSSSVTVPANTAAGQWNVGALADVYGVQAETDEFNNALLAVGPLTVTQPPRPDLRMVSMGFSPAQLDAGQSLSISESVVNQGLAPAGPFKVGVYLSTDAVIETTDTLIGFRALGGLSIGENSSVSAPLVVPATIGTGTFYVGAIADHDQLLVESDEDNNVILALGTVQIFVPPLPNLTTVAVSFGPTVALSGDTITVVERVRNSGTASAGAFRVATYLSINPSVTSSDTLLGFRDVAGLAVGAENDSVNTYPLPLGLGTGSYTLGVIVDDLQTVQEPLEGDNLLVAPGLLDVTGSADDLPDLIVELLVGGPSQVLADGPISVQSLIRNQGDLSTGLFRVHFYLSTDDVIETTDYLIGVRTIPSLAIGGGSAQSFQYTLDGSVPLGDYRFGAICDATEQVQESDEGNNDLLALGQIEVYEPPPPAPDLTLTALSANLTTLVVETDIQLSHTVKNVGDLDAQTAHVNYYFSTDDEVTIDDIFVGSSLTIPGIAVDAESQGATTVTLPAAVTAGTWYVGAIVVIDSGPADSNLSNDDIVVGNTVEVSP